MEAILLYNHQGLEERKKEAELILANLIMCRRLSFTGITADVFYIYTNFHTFSPKLRQHFIAVSMRNAKQNEEGVQQYLSAVSKVEQGSKIKGKNPKLIVAHEKLKRSLKAFDDTFVLNAKNTLEDFHLLPIVPFITYEPSSASKPVSAIAVNMAKDEDLNDFYISLSQEIISGNELFPAFYSIKSLGERFIALNEAGNAWREAFFIHDLLYRIPLPYKLTTPQLILLREQMGNVSHKLFEALAELKKKLLTIPFTKAEYGHINNLYTQATAELKQKLQQLIEANALFNELKEEQKSGEGISVHIGITSSNNLIKILERTSVCSPTILMYVREELTSKMDLNNATFFLFTMD